MIVKSVRLVNTTGSHNKFYEVEIHQNDYGFAGHHDYSVKARWGKIGNTPKEADKGSFDSVERANVVYQDLVSQKLAKGYIVNDDSEPPSVSRPQPVRHEHGKVWTKANIEANPSAFTEALRFALQKGAA